MSQETQAKMAILEQELVAANEKISSLTAEVNTLRSLPNVVKKAAPADLPVFKVGGKEYQFTAGQFILNGEKVTAKEAVKSKEIKELIVEKGFGFIQQV